MNDFEMHENLTRFREPLIEKIIDSLPIEPDSRGIDIGCGIGRITNLLHNKIDLKQKLIGLDFNKERIAYAKKHRAHKNISFIQGDINNLTFDSHSFDWIWSMDTIWAGPSQFGCPAENPDEILKQFYNILKPDGKIFLAFWSSQKLIPGHPLLEARLNAATSANAPYGNDMDPYSHMLYGKKWLRNAQFQNIEAHSFVGDINGPLNEEDNKAVNTFFQMFWGNAEEEVSTEDWKKFKDYCTSTSENYILNNPDYYGFFIYTLFSAIKA